MNTAFDSLTHKMQRAALGKTVDLVLSHAEKDPAKTVGQIVDLSKQFYGDSFSDETYAHAKQTLTNPDSKWSKLINCMLNQLDPNVARTTALNLGYEAFFRGTKTIRENRVKYQCNVPWLILFDPTSACNMHCVGCWAGEYGNKNNLSFDDMDKIVSQGKELGVYLYMLTEAIDSYPAMADKKLIIVKDFDLFKPPAGFADVLPSVLGDLPEYVCLVFYYDVLDGKPDKRTKLYKTLEKHACFAEFAHAEEQELVAWLERRAKALGCMIEPGDASYMIFLCGNSMTNLAGEMEKAAAHTTTGVIKRYNIDAVCSPVLDAVVFDLTDAVTAGRFDRAVALVGELLAQKNNEVMIFTAITRHIQRLYAAKLCAENRGGEKQLMEMIGSKSPYYARQIQNAARRVPLSWLRKAASLCAETDAALKGGAADRQKQIELTLLTMAAELKGEKK